MSDRIEQIDTPALLFDLDLVERNVTSMAEVPAGCRRRPATTREDAQVAGVRPDAGRGCARGLTVAKLGEAEVMVDAFLDFMRREHGVGHIAGGDDVSDGERLQVVPLHVRSCVNLFEMAFGMRGDRVDHEMAIQARGCVR